tara:strand:+ start:483 stop:662 length:180 start_codon:yes stop_codon:yes gene_type:complete
MKQISAVEQLQKCLSIHLSNDQQMQFEGLFQQALEMEKQQTKEAYLRGIMNYDPTFKSE